MSGAQLGLFDKIEQPTSDKAQSQRATLESLQRELDQLNALTRATNRMVCELVIAVHRGDDQPYTRERQALLAQIQASPFFWNSLGYCATTYGITDPRVLSDPATRLSALVYCWHGGDLAQASLEVFIDLASNPDVLAKSDQISRGAWLWIVNRAAHHVDLKEETFVALAESMHRVRMSGREDLAFAWCFALLHRAPHRVDDIIAGDPVEDQLVALSDMLAGAPLGAEDFIPSRRILESACALADLSPVKNRLVEVISPAIMLDPDGDAPYQPIIDAIERKGEESLARTMRHCAARAMYASRRVESATDEMLTPLFGIFWTDGYSYRQVDRARVLHLKERIKANAVPIELITRTNKVVGTNSLFFTPLLTREESVSLGKLLLDAGIASGLELVLARAPQEAVRLAARLQNADVEEFESVFSFSPLWGESKNQVIAALKAGSAAGQARVTGVQIAPPSCFSRSIGAGQSLR